MIFQQRWLYVVITAKKYYEIMAYGHGLHGFIIETWNTLVAIAIMPDAQFIASFFKRCLP